MRALLDGACAAPAGAGSSQMRFIRLLNGGARHKCLHASNPPL